MHRFWALVVATIIISATACFAGAATLPPHPTLIYAEYKGQKHLVIAADKDKPVILFERKRVSLPSDTPLSTERAPGYSGQSATLSNQRVIKSAIQRDRYNTTAAFEEKSAEISAAQDLRDCFLVIIHFEEEFLMSDEQRVQSRKKNAEIFHDRPVSRPQIHVQQISDLKATQPATVTFSSIITLDPRSTNLPGGVAVTFKTHILHLLFSEGEEVRTNQPEIAREYFYHREKLLHSLVLRRWLKQNEKTDQPLRPVLQIPPLLDSTEGVPKDATATLTVGSDGTVNDVSIDREFPTDVREILTTTLRAWLFLPKIKTGVPVVARVGVPLQF